MKGKYFKGFKDYIKGALKGLYKENEIMEGIRITYRYEPQSKRETKKLKKYIGKIKDEQKVLIG